MTADEARAADTAEWLRRADTDLRAADVDMRADPALLGDAAFHAQQAAEKAMKALLAWHDVPFRKTHDLAALGEACAAIAPRITETLRAAAPLTQYAWRFRYPGEPADPSRQESETAISVARVVVAAARQALGEAGFMA